MPLGAAESPRNDAKRHSASERECAGAVLTHRALGGRTTGPRHVTACCAARGLVGPRHVTGPALQSAGWAGVGEGEARTGEEQHWCPWPREAL